MFHRSPFPSSFQLRALLAIAGFLLSAFTAHALSAEFFRSLNQPVPPFRIIGNIHYVGASDIASYLITTSAGHILLEGGLVETAPQIEKNIRELGFRVEDIKLLITSHAHLDHAGGLAELKRLSGARLLATAPEVETLARGGKGDFQYDDTLPFPPVVADQMVSDGETIELGGVKLTAHLTPGHTKGCTTWTTRVEENSRTYNIVFMASLTAGGYKLVNNAAYPNIASDFLRSCELLRALPCDVFLSPHGSTFSLTEKRARLGAEPNPFLDPVGYQKAIDQAERQIRHQLKLNTPPEPSAPTPRHNPTSSKEANQMQ